MNDQLSQEEIDKLTKAAAAGEDSSEAPALDADAAPAVQSSSGGDDDFSADDLDALGELNNIFMGSASTTLSTLLQQRVEITTPEMQVVEDLGDSYINDSEDYTIVEISYIEGLEGVVKLALKTQDTAIIADLMMGGDGKVDATEIGELQLSAVSEAMNQMIGSASTSLSGMLNKTINISHPEMGPFDDEQKAEMSQNLQGKKLVSAKFNLIIGDLIDSEMVQLMSADTARSQVNEIKNMMKNMSENMQSCQSQSLVDGLMDDDVSASATSGMTPPETLSGLSGVDSASSQNPVTVQPVQFASFDNAPNSAGSTNQNLNLVMDVNLELTVELGRTELPIKEVLELTRGSIIELEKVAGEPVELFVNGKLIAKGEVVVIEDNFGLRITSIISPEQRIKHI